MGAPDCHMVDESPTALMLGYCATDWRHWRAKAMV